MTGPRGRRDRQSPVVIVSSAQMRPEMARLRAEPAIIAVVPRQREG
jgi:hypothetical protein